MTGCREYPLVYSIRTVRKRSLLMGDNTVEVTDQNFAEVVGSTTPTLVDFWAEWCGPCKMMNGPLDEIAGANKDKLTVAKLNVDENQSTAMSHEVMSIPTMIVFQDGVEKKRLVGARSKAQLESELAEFV
jgi:thioredoxin 1